MINKKVYEKHLHKKKNFKALLAEDEEEIQFYDQLRKRELDKISNNKQSRGTFSFFLKPRSSFRKGKLA
jgi:hypothetical protein